MFVNSICVLGFFLSQKYRIEIKKKQDYLRKKMTAAFES